MGNAALSLSGGLVVLLLLGACSRGAAPAAPTDVAPGVAAAQTAVSTLEARFDPTAAAGGGLNASGGVAADEINRTFGAVAQAAQLKFSANASPPGATGAAVQSISITGEDPAGVLSSLSANDKKTLGESLLNAAAAAWPQARITLLVSGKGQIIATRPPGGPNTVIAT